MEEDLIRAAAKLDMEMCTIASRLAFTWPTHEMHILAQDFHNKLRSLKGMGKYVWLEVWEPKPR